MLAPQFSIRARESALHELLVFNREDLDLVHHQGSIVVREDVIGSDPKFVEQFVRGTVKGLLYVPANPTGVIPVRSRQNRIKEEEGERIFFKFILPAMTSVDRQDLTEAILAGKLTLGDIDPERTDFTRLQDDIAQIGQGRIVDQSLERLGRADAGVILVRKIWRRELQALSENRVSKSWLRPAQMGLVKYSKTSDTARA